MMQTIFMWAVSTSCRSSLAVVNWSSVSVRGAVRRGSLMSNVEYNYGNQDTLCKTEVWSHDDHESMNIIICVIVMWCVSVMYGTWYVREVYSVIQEGAGHHADYTLEDSRAPQAPTLELDQQSSLWVDLERHPNLQSAALLLCQTCAIIFLALVLASFPGLL